MHFQAQTPCQFWFHAERWAKEHGVPESYFFCKECGQLQVSSQIERLNISNYAWDVILANALSGSTSCILGFTIGIYSEKRSELLTNGTMIAS